MQHKDNIIFDLDGTIIDSSQGITGSVQHALQEFGIPVEDASTLTKFIGPPLLDSFQNYYDFSPEKSREAVKIYRAYFDNVGVHQNVLYPGIAELIKALAEQGKKLAVATTKPEIYAVQILEELRLDSYFAYIAGSELDGSRTNKAELIHYAMHNASIQSIEDSVMIGDTRFDILAATEVGMDSIGVEYGFSRENEFITYPPTKIVASTKQLGELLLEK